MTNLTNETIDDVLHQAEIKEYLFPIFFEFKIGTFANDFIVKDAKNKTLAYVRQKMFKLKESIQVFSDESKSNIIYTIEADRIIDFNSCYSFKNDAEEILGKVGRKGMRSIWKASYDIFDKNNNILYQIKEENPWAKVFDSLLGEIPVISLFTGYFFNPKYIVIDKSNTIIMRLSKEPSFFGRKFKLNKISQTNAKQTELILLSLMMMSLLERQRG